MRATNQKLQNEKLYSTLKNAWKSEKKGKKQALKNV